jgi:hypothetical protein
MDNLHVRLNFNLSKEKGIKHHSLKEHNEIRKIAKVACYELVVINLLRADDIRLVGTTCCESVGLINLVTR